MPPAEAQAGFCKLLHHSTRPKAFAHLTEQPVTVTKPVELGQEIQRVMGGASQGGY